MLSTSKADACAGVIYPRSDATLLVEDEDLIDVQLAPTMVATPPPVPLLDLMQLPAPEPPLDDEELERLVTRPGRSKRVITAVGLGAATMAGILVAIAAHRHVSAPDPAAREPSAAVAIRVRPAAHPAPEARRARPARVRAASHRPRIARRPAVRSRLRGKSRSFIPERPVGARGTRSRLRRHVHAAQRAARRGKWALARREARRALRIDRRNRAARVLERRARRKLITGQLKHARRDLKRHRYKHARRRAAVVLRIDPRNRSARRIKRWAEARIRRRHQV